MTTSAVFKPGVGVLLTVNGAEEGMTIIITDSMLLSAVEKHVAEVVDWLI